MAKSQQQKQLNIGKRIKSDDELLKKFNVKPCQVNMTRTVYSKIGMTCSASSSDGSPVSCKIVQDQSNTFTIKIKKLRNDDSSEEFVHESKKPRTAVAPTNCEQKKKKKQKSHVAKESKSRAIARSVSKPTPCDE